jgi:hypothetical protein
MLLAVFVWSMLPHSSAATYDRVDSYSGLNFFSGFDFNVFDDPTHGYVDFVDQSVALSEGLINVTTSNQVYIGTDYSNVVADGERGRKSIRLQSKKSYNGKNLIVIDLEHMPTTVGSLQDGCSSWPAFWTVGSDWPTKGEIDIIEYVNTDEVAVTTLHTDEGCDQGNEDTSLFTGVWGLGAYGNPADNCDVNAADQWANEGCGILGAGSTNPQPKVGAAFNALGKGGVYALEWLEDNYIRAFYFERDDIPSDIKGRSSITPDTSTWGLPYARFELGADCPSDHFQKHNIIFDNTFCGDWAGNTFSQSCSTDVSCNDYVKFNPSYFQESYWLINYVDVYES